MSSAAALSWFARHEIRLAWREWLAMMTAGRRLRKHSAIIGLIVFAAIMHLPAYAVVGRFANLAAPLDKTTLIVITSTIVLAWALMLSQAIESVTRVFYARADLDLIMSSPAALANVFSVRIAARICATRRVRLGPISRNNTTVIAIATAAADRPMPMTTPNADSHRTPPPITRTSTKGVDSTSAIAVTVSAIAAIRTENTLASVTGDDMIRSRSARA